jgi:hypothetical protein
VDCSRSPKIKDVFEAFFSENAQMRVGLWVWVITDGDFSIAYDWEQRKKQRFQRTISFHQPFLTLACMPFRLSLG